MSIVRKAYTRAWMWVVTGTAVGAGLSGGLIYSQHRAQATEVSSLGDYCDNGIGAAKAHAASAQTPVAAAASTSAVTQSSWIPKINDTKPPGPAPAGMAWIPGGQFWMGSDDERMLDTRPWHRVYVDGFWMDKTDVTNEEFARFVKATRAM